MTPRTLLGIVVALGVLASASALAGERTLLRKQSPYNTIIVSEDDEGLRILRFEDDGARQTVVKPGDPDHLAQPYARVAPAALALVEAPERVLVIGLGGGAIPSFLRRRYPALRIDAVELDPVVVEVAKSHFGFREDERLRVHVEDGRAFIERHADAFDVVYLDAFGTDSVPYPLVTREFLMSVRRALKPRGVAVGNVWGRDANALYDSMVRTYRTVYEDVSIIDIEGAVNKLVIACPRKRHYSKPEFVQRGRALGRRLGLRSDLGDLLEQGWRESGEDGARGRVLSDWDPAPR